MAEFIYSQNNTCLTVRGIKSLTEIINCPQTVTRLECSYNNILKYKLKNKLELRGNNNFFNKDVINNPNIKLLDKCENNKKAINGIIKFQKLWDKYWNKPFLLNKEQVIRKAVYDLTFNLDFGEVPMEWKQQLQCIK